MVVFNIRLFNIYMISKKNKIPYPLFTELLSAKSKKGGGQYVNIRVVRMEDTTLDSRFSFVVSTKVSKLAVARNKIKRCGYGTISKYLNNINSGYCVFFYFKKGSSGVSCGDIEKDIILLLKEYGVLPVK